MGLHGWVGLELGVVHAVIDIKRELSSPVNTNPEREIEVAYIHINISVRDSKRPPRSDRDLPIQTVTSLKDTLPHLESEAWAFRCLSVRALLNVYSHRQSDMCPSTQFSWRPQAVYSM